MQEATHRFIRLLRLRGVRIGVSEAVDAMRAATLPGVLADRQRLHDALAVCLIKDRRDEETFDRIFDRFFRLQAVDPAADDHGHGHSHDDLSDEGELDRLTLSDEPGDTPEEGHTHGKPADIREYFDPEDLAQQYNLHQEANKLDMASMTEEIVLSNDTNDATAEAARVQLTTSRLHNAGRPGDLAAQDGPSLDADLSVAQEQMLLDWLDDSEQGGAAFDSEDLRALRAALSGLLEDLPARLRDHLEKLLASEHHLEKADIEARHRTAVDEQERAELEEALRRLIRSLHGAPRARRRVAARGAVDGSRTMRTNMRFDGVPFRPVTVARVADRPRLLVLADVSLSVRATARFTLQLVHRLQHMVSQVRSFAFVSDVVEVTDLFDEHPLEEALSLVVGGLSEGGVLDVDADSDYGRALGGFLEEYGSAVTRRTTLVVLGDGRGNRRDPNLAAFEELTRRARETVWLTPEPSYSWRLGSCDLPAYATYCDRVHVVRDLSGLDLATTAMLGGTA